MIKGIVQTPPLPVPLPAANALASATSTTVPINPAPAVSLSAQGHQALQRATGEQGVGGELGLQNLLSKLERELREAGAEATLLLQRPDSADAARLALADQAVTFALDPANATNPFAGLARQNLSGIAYDDSGAFTAAERSAAYSELSKRDDQYNAQLSEQIKRQLGDKDPHIAELMRTQAQLMLVDSMSDAEKASLTFSVQSHQAQMLNAQAKGINVPALERYDNLLSRSEGRLAASTDDTGKAMWQDLADALLSAKDGQGKGFTVLQTALNANAQATASASSGPGAWVHIYKINQGLVI